MSDLLKPVEKPYVSPLGSTSDTPRDIPVSKLVVAAQLAHKKKIADEQETKRRIEEALNDQAQLMQLKKNNGGKVPTTGVSDTMADWHAARADLKKNNASSKMDFRNTSNSAPAIQTKSVSVNNDYTNGGPDQRNHERHNERVHNEPGSIVQSSDGITSGNGSQQSDGKIHSSGSGGTTHGQFNAIPGSKSGLHALPTDLQGQYDGDVDPSTVSKHGNTGRARGRPRGSKSKIIAGGRTEIETPAGSGSGGSSRGRGGRGRGRGGRGRGGRGGGREQENDSSVDDSSESSDNYELEYSADDCARPAIFHRPTHDVRRPSHKTNNIGGTGGVENTTNTIHGKSNIPAGSGTSSTHSYWAPDSILQNIGQTNRYGLASNMLPNNIPPGYFGPYDPNSNERQNRVSPAASTYGRGGNQNVGESVQTQSGGYGGNQTVGRLDYSSGVGGNRMGDQTNTNAGSLMQQQRNGVSGVPYQGQLHDRTGQMGFPTTGNPTNQNHSSQMARGLFNPSLGNAQSIMERNGQQRQQHQSENSQQLPRSGYHDYQQSSIQNRHGGEQGYSGHSILPSQHPTEKYIIEQAILRSQKQLMDYATNSFQAPTLKGAGGQPWSYDVFGNKLY